MSDNEMISVQIIKTNEKNILVQRVNADTGFTEKQSERFHWCLCRRLCENKDYK